MNLVTGLSRTLAIAASVAGIACAFVFAFSEEPATGRLSGAVVLRDTGKPLGGVEVFLSPVDRDEQDPALRRTRIATTDPDGRFVLRQVPTGEYTLSASSSSHAASAQPISISEEGFTQALLTLDRSEPTLRVAQQRRVRTTREVVALQIRGYVDPAKPPHTDTLTVALYRARLGRVLADPAAAAALSQVGSYNPATSLPTPLMHPASGPAPEPVLARVVRIVEDDREGFFDQRVAFGALRPGLYLAQIQCGANGACEAIQVTDLALVVKRAKDRFLAFATDLTTGVPVAGVSVRAMRSQKVIRAVTTDRQGVAVWSMPPAEGRGASQEGGESAGAAVRTVVVASRGEDDAVCNNEAYEPEGAGRFAIHLQTDRPIYRPNQTICYKGIARVRQAGGFRYALPGRIPVHVEVRDPGGELVSRSVLAANDFGSFAGRVQLSAEAPTGVYTLVVTLGGQKHTHDIVVASYKKPEFSVTVTPVRPRTVRGQPAEYRVSAEYYFGAPLAGATVSYNAYSTPDWRSNPSEEDDEEYSEEREWRRERLYGSNYGSDTAEGTVELDERGQAVVRIDTRQPPGDSGPIDEVLTLYATVKDAAGRETQAQGEVRVVQGDLRVDVAPTGYLATPGQPTDVVVSAAPFDGAPGPNVPIELEYGYTRWVRASSGLNGQSGYEFRYAKAGVVQGLTGADGRALLRVTPPRAGDLRLTARARDAAGRVIEARTEIYCTSESTDSLDTEYADLAVFTDKRRYAPGETARILISALHTGPTALLTIEGDRIFRYQTVPIQRHSTVITLPVLAEYGPNVYVAVCSVRDRKFARSVQSLRVDLPAADVRVDVRPDRPAGAAPPRYAPGDPIAWTVTTTAANGRPIPCEVSFGVVDEAIYALREDNPGAIRSSFYPRRQNRVYTDYSFALEMLGDADKAEPMITARRRFPDTAYWAPFVRTDAQGRARIAFRLPDNLTTWRATAVACSPQTAVGFGVGKVVVSKDLLVRLETPRTLTQGDRSTFVAAVHNDTSFARTALVRLTADGLALLGADTRTLEAPPHGAATVSFQVRADRPGPCRLRITAWTPKNPRMPQLTDGIETSIEILPDGHEVRDVFAGLARPGRPEIETFRFDPAAIPGYERLTIRITPSIRAPLGSALNYLASFPYGCTEQTLSRFVPLMVARRLRQEKLTAFAIPNEDRVVRDGLTRLYRFQREQGYWGWWEEDSVDAWMTSYAVYGLATARALGEPVSAQALERGRKALAALLPRCTPEEKGFALYALALAGDTRHALAAARNMQTGTAPTETLAYLALLDRLTGVDPAPAVGALLGRAQTEGPLMHWTACKNQWGWSDWSDVMATALAARALAAVDPRHPAVGAAVRWLMLQRTGEAWPSTRDTAWVVEALAAVAERAPELAGSPEGEIRVRLNGAPIRTIALTQDALREPELIVRPPAALLRPGKNEVALERTGGSPVFYSVEARQIVPGPTPPGASAPPVTIRREWYRLEPRREPGGHVRLEAVPARASFRPGDRIRVKLILDVRREMTYAIVHEPFPAGCEVNERGSADEAVQWGYWWSGIDVRDDHIAFFATNLSVGRHEIEYNLTARTPGAYRLLPTTVQGMYDPASRSEGTGERVEVRP